MIWNLRVFRPEKTKCDSGNGRLESLGPQIVVSALLMMRKCAILDESCFLRHEVGLGHGEIVPEIKHEGQWRGSRTIFEDNCSTCLCFASSTHGRLLVLVSPAQPPDIIPFAICEWWLATRICLNAGDRDALLWVSHIYGFIPGKRLLARCVIEAAHRSEVTRLPFRFSQSSTRLSRVQLDARRG